MRKIPELLILVCSCYGGLWAQLTTIVLYPIPTPNAHPTSITAGPDGNLWFTEQNPGKVGKITPNGVITEYALPIVGAYPVSITAGPDGNLWVTEGAGNSNRIARITTSGAVTEYPVPTTLADPNGITVGPDGNLWFSEFGAPNIGKITPAGVITEFANYSPSYYCIAVGPDGNLWNAGYGQLVRINTFGESQVFPVSFNANWITSGPDGNLWFTYN